MTTGDIREKYVAAARLDCFSPAVRVTVICCRPPCMIVVETVARAGGTRRHDRAIAAHRARALTEEQIRAHTVGDLAPLTGPIRLVDYDPRWPELFRREAARIRAALGDRVLRIGHTGSTAVPGLVAKPIVDPLQRQH